MRIQEPVRHPTTHAALTNVTSDQHHEQPSNIEVSNTSQLVDPLPGGPGYWDIAVPFSASVVNFSFRSNKTVEKDSAKAGCTGVANRSVVQAASFSHDGVISNPAEGAFYAKTSGALNLSHKVFSSLGTDVALSNIWLEQTGPSTRVLRTEWTNYGAVQHTLNVWGQIQVVG